MNITKAIIPCAGKGTRFAPYTTLVPKELLPLITHPAIHYTVTESIDAGITDISIITNDQKELLARYCDVREKNGDAQFAYFRQQTARGLGDAILKAATHIGDAYFGVLLPDDIITSTTPALAQLISIARQRNASVIAVKQVPREQISAYGVIALKEQYADNLYTIASVIEKPKPSEAPSEFAIVGRYIFSPTILSLLKDTPPSPNGEIQLTDAITELVATEPVFAYVIDGDRYDIGTPAGWLLALDDFAKKSSL